MLAIYFNQYKIDFDPMPGYGPVNNAQLLHIKRSPSGYEEVVSTNAEIIVIQLICLQILAL